MDKVVNGRDVFVGAGSRAASEGSELGNVACYEVADMLEDLGVDGTASLDLLLVVLCISNVEKLNKGCVEIAGDVEEEGRVGSLVLKSPAARRGSGEMVVIGRKDIGEQDREMRWVGTIEKCVLKRLVEADNDKEKIIEHSTKVEIIV